MFETYIILQNHTVYRYIESNSTKLIFAICCSAKHSLYKSKVYSIEANIHKKVKYHVILLIEPVCYTFQNLTKIIERYKKKLVSFYKIHGCCTDVRFLPE